VYNGEPYLVRALNSLVAQENVDFELVIADNCSTDATEEVCRDLARHDPRVRYIRRPENVGVHANHNMLVHETHGELIAYAASDDEYCSSRLYELEEALRNSPESVLAFSAAAEIDPSGQIVRRWHNQCRTDHIDPSVRVYDLFARHHPFLQFYGLIRRDVLVQTRLQPQLKSGDRMLLAELALRGKFAFVPNELLFWRQHPEKTSAVMGARAFHLAGGLAMPNVDEGRFLLTAIARTPLENVARMRCYFALRAWARRNAVPMMRNLARAAIDTPRALVNRGTNR
jgi:glycosyltransferase involved in cell wall biosynthesis